LPLVKPSRSTADRAPLALAEGELCTEALGFLASQRQRLLKQTPLRPWYFWESHNPWGGAANLLDSWGLLDLARDPTLLDSVESLLGPDLILYDSGFAPVPAARRSQPAYWRTDALRCPVQPRAGAVVHLLCATAAGATVELRAALGDTVRRMPLCAGLLLVHDIEAEYRYLGLRHEDIAVDYTLRYFPATSLYLRDQDSDDYRQRNCAWPLLNYAALPLWLVRGSDRAGNDFVTGFRRTAAYWIDGGN
jgi:hypothetical protein